MSSNAEIIRSSFKELLSDGQVHNRTELFEYARNAMPEANFTEGMLTGALKTLTDPGTGYKNVGRALYQKMDTSDVTGQYMDILINAYVNVFKATLKNIDAEIQPIIDPFKIMEANDEEKARFNEVKRCLDVINEVIEHLE